MEKVFTAFEWCFVTDPYGVYFWEEGLTSNNYLLEGATLEEVEDLAGNCKTKEEFEDILDERYDVWPK